MPRDAEMNEVPRNLRDYVSTLRKGWKLILLVGVVVAGLALVSSLVQGPTYVSEALVLAEPFSDAIPGEGQINLQTEKELIGSATVVRRVMDDLAITGDEVEFAPLTVDPLLQTEVLKVGYEAGSATEAARRAQAFAEQYLAYRRDRAAEALETARDTVTRRAVQARVRLERLRRQAAEARRSGDRALIATLGTERDALVFQLGSLQDSLAALQPTLIDAGGGHIIEAAEPAKTRSAPEPVRNTALGFVLGLVLGVGITIFRAHLAAGDSG